MKGAIIGFGKIAIGHLEGYRRCDGLSVTSIVDVSPERRSIAEECFGLTAYSTFEQLVQSQDLDFIDVCTPPDTHAIYSAQALDGGFHTLCEKPVFLPDRSGYQDQISKINSSNKLFYPCHVYKYSPILTEVRKLVQDGKLGRILRADFKTFRLGHALGVEDWDPDWRRKPSISKGGILRDHGPHSIYAAMHLTNSIPLSVSCIAGRFGEGFPETEDTAFVHMRCTNDVEVSFTLSWSASHRSTCYSLSGTHGTLIVDDDKLAYASYGRITKKEINSEFNDPSHKSWFRDMFLDFEDLVRNPARRAPIIIESLMTSAAIDAAYNSSYQFGEWVDLDTPKYPAAWILDSGLK
ncbi:Gfo/Idh/MocA family protein [Photorhabdus heterorhabditis]|uniref:Gfo/Idh/MocA family protein n=1 Tax=Photorhabdus heterorhabditis TaxID=880156 RepID=UPI0015627B55|nr:Gfo/Idh/MocA family oxidoreductase [Photorhabdus heterorhabditis]NRN27060.1 Gfo/Idh/MocA family oxidoreductase [Photorhabdus heterorhabditis subsp. aluminescens]